jgi:hypothetical protein
MNNPVTRSKEHLDRMTVLCYRFVSCLSLALCVISTLGCNLVPDFKRKPQYHNPFPQLSKVAVMPFRNQSQEPTLSGARVSMAYYNELQSISGFEVIPFGVVENQLAYFEMQILKRPLMAPGDFQQFAKYLGVDAVLQGAITDYDPYYPPRMTMKVNWYAANPGFHPIPVGYGLPWGTKAEKKIPEWIRLESERALAVEQLKTQTPVEGEEPENNEPSEDEGENSLPTAENSRRATPTDSKESRIAAARIALPIYSESQSQESKVVLASATDEPAKMPEAVVGLPEPRTVPAPPAPQFKASGSVDGNAAAPETLSDTAVLDGEQYIEYSDSGELPANWPDPQGFIPRRPAAQTPQMKVQYEPIISHMRTYNGNDEDFTHALGEYFYFRDDARTGGWQSYLQRSEDFIRFCCHQHIVETLASRGGQLESRMILRWPINRYER